MKNVLCLLLACTLSFTTLFSQSLVWKNDEPKAGEKVTFTYNPAGTPLANEKNIDAIAFCINKKNGSAKEIDLKKTGNSYSGSFVTDTNTVLVAMKFSSGDIKDVNRKNGYLLAIRDKGGKIQPGTYNAYADQYAGYGNFLYGLDVQPEYVFNYRKQEWKEFPENHAENLMGYLQALSTQKKKEAEPEILQILGDIVSAGSLTEMQYNGVSMWYQRLQQKDKAEALRKEMKEKFPDGSWKKNDKMNEFFTERDPVKKQLLLDNILATFPPATDQDKMTTNYLYSALANEYAQPEQLKNGGFEKFKLYAEKIPIEQRVGLYNNVAWNMAGKDLMLDKAKELSATATQWAKKEIIGPSAKKPDMATTKTWEENRKQTYAMFADTYGYILYKLKEYKEAFPYAKESAVDIKKKKNAEYNDRYAILLEKVATPAEVQKELEVLIEDNMLMKEGKEVFRRALVANLKDQQKADQYYAELLAKSQEKTRKELAKKMLNEDASTFKLKNLQGEEVSLASLKGKVVVLDFWATWCGPCKASFPAMQKTVEKYKNNDNVVFLFINTWESQETIDKRKKEVSDFIAQHNYTFNVLYDESINNDANNYQVVNNYKVSGIPTKFIIGKDGKMRFRSVGFSGSDDALVDEISAMIDIAGNN